MKKRTKKYTPRALVNPLDTISKHSLETISDDSFTSLGILFLGALDGMTGSAANEEMWSNLVCALNTSLLLCQAGIKQEMTRTVDAALDAMVKVQMRARNGHGWQLGNHYNTVRAGMTVHHEHMTKQPKHVLKKALAEVMRRTGNLEVAEGGRLKSCSNCQHRRCRPSNEPLIERMLVWKCDISKRKIANTSAELEKLKGCEKWTK